MKSTCLVKTLLLGALVFLVVSKGEAQEGTTGEIRMFAGNFAPRNWAFCEGQLLPLESNTALFSVIGATYGGDAKTTFALPDLRDRAPIHAGSGPGLNPVRLGEQAGGVNAKPAEQGKPTANTRSTLAIRYIICLQGSYPVRS